MVEKATERSVRSASRAGVRPFDLARKAYDFLDRCNINAMQDLQHSKLRACCTNALRPIALFQSRRHFGRDRGYQRENDKYVFHLEWWLDRQALSRPHVRLLKERRRKDVNTMAIDLVRYPLSWIVGLSAITSVSAAVPAKLEQIPAKTFSDCVTCGQMVVIPTGSNELGSTTEERARVGIPAVFGDREGPRYTVTIKKPFALGQTEVTVGQFAAFVAATQRPDPAACIIHHADSDKWKPEPGVNWHNPGYPQTDKHPVVCVTYDDAVDYAAWLARTTGKPYRLASEEEWEYAARGGTKTAWYWGDDPEQGCKKAALLTSGTMAAFGWPRSMNGMMICSDPTAFARPVASFAPNPFGLYDMIGNAFEWVADCSETSHAGDPGDGSVRKVTNCQKRMLKGGGYHTPFWLTRAAVRSNPLPPSFRMMTVGFRVARDL